MDDITKPEFLEVFPEFGGAPDALFAEMLPAMRRMPIPAGSPVYTEGDTCGMFLFLLSGDIRVYKATESGREITLYDIGPGETCIINASCILSGKHAPANAVTLTDCDAWLLPASIFSSLADRYETVRGYVFRVLADNLSSVMQLVGEVAFERMDERLMEYLVEKSEDGELHATHQKIASDLGTSREVVSRLLKEFERQGRLSLSRNLIKLATP